MNAMAKLSWYLRREWPSLILSLAAAALVVNGVAAPRGLRDLLILRQDRSQLEASRDRLQHANDALKAQIQRLRSDDKYLQGLIRQELGFVRPDELVYKFGADRPASR